MLTSFVSEKNIGPIFFTFFTQLTAVVHDSQPILIGDKYPLTRATVSRLGAISLPRENDSRLYTSKTFKLFSSISVCPYMRSHVSCAMPSIQETWTGRIVSSLGSGYASSPNISRNGRYVDVLIQSVLTCGIFSVRVHAWPPRDLRLGA